VVGLDAYTVTALSAVVSASTLEWLQLLSEEYGVFEADTPQCVRFRLDTPDEVTTLHVRRLTPQGSVFLCSTDARFKIAVQSTEQMPFHKFANDPRFVFSRYDNTWIQECREPRIMTG
jgi:hypothetical protein